MNDILEKLKKNSGSKYKDTLEDSKIFKQTDMASTDYPMINVALSSKFSGGLTPGHTMIAGPSKHFKTMFGLLLAAAYMKKNPKAILLFYINEFGSPEEYFETFGIDSSRVFPQPFMNIEELKSEMVNQLEGLNQSDDVVILIDSIGNAASVKEVEDAKDAKIVTDMTRAKSMKSLFRIITPYLSVKKIPLITINHTYKTLEMYSKEVVGGGTGSYYSADNIWIVGRRQVKDDKELTGYDFIINVEKSRYVREGSKIPITVKFGGGIEKYSGLFDIGVEMGFVTKDRNPEDKRKFQYFLHDPETGEEIGRHDTEIECRNSPKWEDVLKSKKFCNEVEMSYKIGGRDVELFADEEIVLESA